MERDASEQLTQAIVASKRVGIPSEAVVLRHLNHVSRTYAHSAAQR